MFYFLWYYIYILTSKLEDMFVFRKYNRSNDWFFGDDDNSQEKSPKIYQYGDDIKNIDHKRSAKSDKLYISQSKSDNISNIQIYIDQNYNRNHKKEYIYAKINNIKKYLSWFMNVSLIEFGDLNESDIYMSNLDNIINHINNRELDLPFVIVSDFLLISDNNIQKLQYIYQITDLFLFAIPLPKWWDSFHSFYLDKKKLSNIVIYDI